MVAAQLAVLVPSHALLAQASFASFSQSGRTAPCGFPLMTTHLPAWPGTSHAWHCPSHLVSQHTPSTHCPPAHASVPAGRRRGLPADPPLSHSPGSVQALPFATSANRSALEVAVRKPSKENFTPRAMSTLPSSRATVAPLAARGSVIFPAGSH